MLVLISKMSGLFFVDGGSCCLLLYSRFHHKFVLLHNYFFSYLVFVSSYKLQVIFPLNNFVKYVNVFCDCFHFFWWIFSELAYNFSTISFLLYCFPNCWSCENFARKFSTKKLLCMCLCAKCCKHVSCLSIFCMCADIFHLFFSH